MELVFIDFETATASRDSACSLGLVHVINGQIAEKKQWLIQPPHNDYNSFNTEIHGITPEMTENSPTFGELWNNISQYFSGKTLVAHNASFDMSVLRATLNYYNIPFPCFDYFCTLVMARAALPKRITYSLDSLCDEFGIAFKHHDATEDAYASFELYKRIFQISEQEKIDDFLEKYGLQLGKSFENGYTRCGIVKKSYSIDFKSLHAENDIIEEVGIKPDQKTATRFIIHVCCMIERLMKGETLPYRGWEDLKKREEKVFSAIEDKFVFIQYKFGVTVPPEEISYLVELFLAEMAQ